MTRILTVVSLGLALSLTAPACSAPKKEGKRCKRHDECKKGLKCVHRRCADISGKKPPCPWVMRCLKRLGKKLKAKGKRLHSYKVVKRYKRLSTAAWVEDCKDTVGDIARWFSHRPNDWKLTCGRPPVPGVKKITNKSNPFEIVEKVISASSVPSDAKQELRDKHRSYPDVCKAKVEFNLTRNFQGYVTARFYEKYNCVKPTKEEIKAAKKAQKKDKKVKLPQPKCKLRPYSRTATRYIPHYRKGSNFRLSFYVSVPPPVCSPKLKPQLGTSKEYTTGCYCLGISEKKFEFEWKDEPFLFMDGKPKFSK